MRGIAAVIVVLHHAGKTPIGGPALFPNGFLAVDFFFLLSGFVISRAYEPRFQDGLRTATFMLHRFRRLLPIMWIGILLGAVTSTLLSIVRPGELLTLFAAQMLFIPVLAGSRSIFVLNGVQWSLYFEFAANIAHAALLRRFNLASLCLLAAGAWAAFAGSAFYFGSVGIGDTGQSYLAGFPRVLATYITGVAIYRIHQSGQLPKVRSPAWMALLALPVLFWLAGTARPHAELSVDLTTIAIFPIVLIIGLSVRLSGISAHAATIMGALSYPLYAIHLPIQYGVRAALVFFHITPSSWTFGFTLVVTLALSWCLARFFEPGARVRKAGRSSDRNLLVPARGHSA
ncbi:MAG TPA: acyltransferase [Sphingomicrobium sp.]